MKSGSARVEHGSTVDVQRSLRVLSVCYVVYGVVMLLVTLLSVAFGLLAFFARAPEDLQNPRAAVADLALVGFFVLLSVWAALCTVLYFFAGRYLRRHRRWWICLIAGCISCLNAPLGTVLGAFTIVVLLLPETRRLFESRSGTTIFP